MKKTLLILGVVILALGAFVFYIFYSTGFFREIEPSDARVDMLVKLPGVEDIEVSYEEDFMIFSSDDRAARRYRRPRQSGLYLFDFKNSKYKELTEQLNFAFFPHGITMHRLDSAVYRIWAINHAYRKHFIEVFDLYGDSLVHREQLQHPSMVSPNDIVALDAERFYFTNDHRFTSGTGLLAENYLGLALSNVIYFDGESYREVADGIAYANGINFDSKKNLLFVASPRDFLVKVYEKRPEGTLDFVENIDCHTGVDNIEIDTSGTLWIGCHPDLLHFTRYAAGKEKHAPSEIITIDYRSEGDYEVRAIFEDDGTLISASTVAIPMRFRIFIGSVMDNKVLVIRQPRK